MTLQTMPPTAVKLIEANFTRYMCDDIQRIETLWVSYGKNSGDIYWIDYGNKPVQETKKTVIDWVADVYTLNDDEYTCYNKADVAKVFRGNLIELVELNFKEFVNK
jgi:hypothetical protein